MDRPQTGGLLTAGYGWDHTLTQMGWFFTKAALLTFGGAYAVLPYVYQGAVDHFHWLTAPQMIDGLALGETTPGPLIMVVAFVGFVGGWARAIAPDSVFWSGALAPAASRRLAMLPIELKYGPNGERIIQEIARVSKPGRRVYKKSRELPVVLQGMGISIVSTSQGILSNREAKSKGVGGEISVAPRQIRATFEVHAVAEEDLRERFADQRPDAAAQESLRRMFTGGTAAEIAVHEQDRRVPARWIVERVKLTLTRTELPIVLEYVIAEAVEGDRAQESRRHDPVRVDVVTSDRQGRSGNVRDRSRRHPRGHIHPCVATRSFPARRALHRRSRPPRPWPDS